MQANPESPVAMSTRAGAVRSRGRFGRFPGDRGGPVLGTAGVLALRAIARATSPAAKLMATATSSPSRTPRRGSRKYVAERRPDRRAERVRGIEPADARADLVLAAHEPAGQDRQRAAHQDARQDEHQAHQDELHDEEGHGRAFEGGRDREVDRFDRLQERRDREREDSDRDLEETVRAQGPVPVSIRPGPEEVAARGEAAHERREDRRHGERRRAEDVRQPPGPEHLVHEAARAGEREYREQRGAPPQDRSRSPGHWPKDGGSGLVFQDFAWRDGAISGER